MVDSKIKAIIFDLDDTLHNVNFLMEIALKKAVQTMIDEGFNCSIEQGFDKIKEIIKEHPKLDKFRELAKAFNQEDEELIKIGENNYRDYDFEHIEIFPETKEVLGKLKGKFKLVLISQGRTSLQNRKIDYLGIRDYFDLVLLPNIDEKRSCFLEVIEGFGFAPEEILVVGDRVDNEIKIGNELGMKTCRLRRGGKYSSVEPKEDEKPDNEIKNLREIYNILGINKKFKFFSHSGQTPSV